MDDVLPLGGVDFCYVLQEREGITQFQRVFLSIHLNGGRDVVGRKKLLRFATGFSTLAVVAPIDFSGSHNCHYGATPAFDAKFSCWTVGRAPARRADGMGGGCYPRILAL